MKKQTLLLLAATFCTAQALATDSSVILYGVADAGIGQIKHGNPDDKRHFISGTMMNFGASRVGLRGTERLGGQTSVGFQFETGLNLGNGQAMGNFWARQANLWLSGGFGTLKLGRAFTPSRNGVVAWSLTGTAGYDVVTNTYGFVGAGSRDSSQISYKTPSFGGLSAELAYVAKADHVVPDASGVDRESDKWDGALVYKTNSLGLGLSVNKTKRSKTNYALGGRYDVNNLSFAASWSDVRNLKNTYRRRRGVSIGAVARFEPGSVTLDLTRDLRNNGSPSNKKYINGLLEARYALSKRTFFYAAYLRLDGTNNYSMGLRHAF